MATISNVSLAITNGAAADTRNVTVSGTLNFDASEVGKSYRLAIKIMGEDKPSDNVPDTDPQGDDDLYTFTWGPWLGKKPYKQFTVTASGAMPFNEVRTLNSTQLDEDSGKVKIGEVGGTPLFLPRGDEVYALVSLSGTPVSIRSAVISGFGA